MKIVEGGNGWKNGAKLFLPQWESEMTEEEASASLIHKLKQVCSWMVDKINQKAKLNLIHCLDEMLEQMIHELMVIGIEWKGAENGHLVHTMGIKKKYDASDVEH